MANTNILTADDLKRIKTTFREIDGNGDGRLTKHELKRACKTMGVRVKREHMTSMLSSMEKCEKEYLTFREFDAFMRDVLEAQIVEDRYLKDVFASMDENGDGHATHDEIAKALGISLDVALEMIGDADKNGDGKLNFKEFTELYRRQND
ncbi:calmodulin-like protein 7 [Mizuhopecten yessoensis]|uniref:calmodulin-like protein 7 n=1 Tax=Mizuhopecten yessoensis TaxID=6573 RepID=UPI000B45CC29|nr:calmodulin-like protein 7 [Mizuhopecten yessoensis]